MKYALCTLLDMAVGYWSEKGWTITPRHAQLFDSKEAAERLIPGLMARENIGARDPNTADDYWIEEVPDPSEFSARPDTW